jgi:regulator of cell morphogenesis and NO signaling
MSMPSLISTVGQLVVDRPARSRVFERLGIDYCCGGKKPLGEACGDKGLDPNRVLRELRAADSETSRSHERNWSRVTLAQLADHIETTHHGYLRSELPRMQHLVEKVARAHGERNPKLHALREVFVAFRQELEQHMFKEEHVLFPMCRELESAHVRPVFHCGTIANPIRVMIQEHDNAGAALERMRTLTNDYAVPADACNTYRAMIDALITLEQDMHQHVHKENNILFPRAVAAEEALARQAGRRDIETYEDDYVER